MAKGLRYSPHQGEITRSQMEKGNGNGASFRKRPSRSERQQRKGPRKPRRRGADSRGPIKDDSRRDGREVGKPTRRRAPDGKLVGH